MDAANVEIFIRGTANYFDEITGTPAEVGTPFLKEEFETTGDYTGTIGISGDQKGCISITLTREMLTEILNIIGEDADEDSLVSDLVGEIANTISGNARENLGTGFMISVPVVIVGPASNVHLTQGLTTFILPVKWKDHVSYLSLSLEKLEV
ncbi:MAG: chemotaxis protein CheX [Verrucomicrobiota bacterium]